MSGHWGPLVNSQGSGDHSTSMNPAWKLHGGFCWENSNGHSVPCTSGGLARLDPAKAARRRDVRLERSRGVAWRSVQGRPRWRGDHEIMCMTELRRRFCHAPLKVEFDHANLSCHFHADFIPNSYRHSCHHPCRTSRRLAALGGRKGPVRERPYDARRTAHD